MSIVGACVYAGNNAKIMGHCYRVGGIVMGYEKIDDGLDPVGRSVVPGNKMKYRIKLLWPGLPELEVIGVNNKAIGKTPTDTWDPKDPTKLGPGKLTWEDRTNAQGELVTRHDSSAVFQKVAKGLQQLYPGTQTHGFANVHDDGVRGGTARDTLRSFMEKMEALNGNLDFFAYAGHGTRQGLPSACLYAKSKEYADFIAILRRILKPDADVIFYACSTAAVNGFAEKVSRDLPGVTVWGHDRPGNGMDSPYVARCVYGKNEHFKTLLGEDFGRWYTHIKSRSDIWRRFPFMDIEDIQEEVRTAVPKPVKKRRKKK